ncbi:TPA: EAL domain-containing protein [Vibrio vulnificus]|nr:EAL domain-containing protein [Vibrio vulnificus]
MEYYSQYLRHLTLTDKGVVANYHSYKLHTVFQKIFNYKLEVVGVESLLRVTSPDGTSIRPDVFFDFVSSFNDTVIILDSIVRLMHTVNFANSEFSDKSLFLNITPHTLFDLKNSSSRDWLSLLTALDINPNQIKSFWRLLKMIVILKTNSQFTLVSLDH